MGLEIWNDDKDYVRGNLFYAGWTTTAANLVNPSEWGNLVLQGQSDYINFAYLVCIVVILSLGYAFLRTIRHKRFLRAKHENGTLINEKIEIKKAKAFLIGNLADEMLDREKVAAQVSLSPAYFGSLFKRETGKSFVDFLLEARIREAENLIKSTDLNITQIAFKVGFSNQNYFSKAFKKIRKVSPTDLRA